MPYDGKVAEQVCGIKGMVVRTNRLRAEPGELIDANGVQFDNLTLRKEAGSVLLDPVGVGTAPSFGGTYSIPVIWGGVLAAYKGLPPPAPAPAFVKALDSDSTSGLVTANTLTIPVGGVPAGNLIVVSVAQLEVSGTFANITVVDSPMGGNTYTQVTSSFLAQPIFAITTSGTGRRRTTQFYSRITTSLVAGDEITVSYTIGGVLTGNQACAAADEYTNIADPPFDKSTFATGTGASKTIGPLGTLSTLPSLLVDVDMANTDLLITLAAPGWSARSTAESTTAPMQTRMFSRVVLTQPFIIGLYDFDPQDIFVGVGTVSTTAGSPLVTGAGTSFLTTNQANAGDFIRIGGETHRVQFVTSDTSLTVDEPWFTTNAGSAYTMITSERLVTATSDGNLYMDQNTGLADDIDFLNIKTGLVPSLVPGKFVLGGRENGPATKRKLFWFSGRDIVQVITSSAGVLSDANIALPPADWTGFNQPVSGVFSGNSNRLVGFGNINDGHRLYFSSATNHEDFTTTPLTVEVYSGIGNQIWCGISFGGLLMFWKYPRGIFMIDDSDTTAPIVRRKSEALGCAPSPHAVLPIDDDVLFLAANGTFHLLSAVDTLSGTRASDLSYRLGISKWIRDHVNLVRLNQVVSVWYPHKKQAYFGVPSTDSNVCDLTLKFDFGGVDTGQDVRFSYSRRDTPGAFAVRRSADPDLHDAVERPINGEGGLVYLMDREARNKAGQPYIGLFQTPFLDFSYVDPKCRTRHKIPEHLEMVFEPVDAGTLVVQPVVDGKNRGTPLAYSPTNMRERQRIGVSKGHTISFIGSESTLNGDFAIDDIIMSFNIGDEDQNVGPR